jgi:hypothetical protein
MFTMHAFLTPFPAWCSATSDGSTCSNHWKVIRVDAKPGLAGECGTPPPPPPQYMPWRALASPRAGARIARVRFSTTLKSNYPPLTHPLLSHPSTVKRGPLPNRRGLRIALHCCSNKILLSRSSSRTNERLQSELSSRTSTSPLGRVLSPTSSLHRPESVYQRSPSGLVTEFSHARSTSSPESSRTIS